jgi:hypothetical protein
MANRTAYARRRNENKVEDLRVRKDEISSSMLAEVSEALDKWEASRRAGQRRQSPPPAARGWHRPWQKPIKEPLGKLLLKAAISAAIHDGRIKVATLDCEGWQDQVLDGEKLGMVPLG